MHYGTHAGLGSTSTSDEIGAMCKCLGARTTLIKRQASVIPIPSHSILKTLAPKLEYIFGIGESCPVPQLRGTCQLELADVRYHKMLDILRVGSTFVAFLGPWWPRLLAACKVLSRGVMISSALVPVFVSGAAFEYRLWVETARGRQGLRLIPTLPGPSGLLPCLFWFSNASTGEMWYSKSLSLSIARQVGD